MKHPELLNHLKCVSLRRRWCRDEEKRRAAWGRWHLSSTKKVTIMTKATQQTGIKWDHYYRGTCCSAWLIWWDCHCRWPTLFGQKWHRDVAVCLIKTALCLWQALGCSKPLGADVISFSCGSFFKNVSFRGTGMCVPVCVCAHAHGKSVCVCVCWSLREF